VIEHYAADDLRIRVPVTFEAGAPVQNLIGAAVIARAVPNRDFASAVDGAVTINAEGTEVTVVFEENTLPANIYTFQVRATKDGYTQTIAADEIRSVRSV